MTPDQRRAICDTAKYLRHVRPIDPTEFSDYVSDNPPAERIRSVLRENALALDLVEHDDGTFTPPAPEPVKRLVRGPITSIPEGYTATLEALLEQTYGANWYKGDTGDHLRRTIRGVKEAYFHGAPVEYTEDTAFGYALYHFPAYYAGIQYVIADLLDRSLLAHDLRVLDVGAGVGAPALGLHDILYPGSPHVETTQTVPPLVEYHAIEPSASTAILTALLDETNRNFHTRLTKTTAELYEPSEPYDLILFANVLSELEDPVDTVTRYAEALSPTGSLVLIAPADKETSVGLRAIERAVVNGLGVYSPTIRLWPGRHPTDQCWSFDSYPDLTIPRFQTLLDNPAGHPGEFVNVDVKFSYAILRLDSERRIHYTPTETRFAKLADTPQHVTNRINCAAIKLSRDLGDNHPLFLVGDGSQLTDHYAVVPATTPANRSLLTAEYGDLLLFENVLVLWNEDETAYNLVADETTAIDHIEPSPSELSH